MTNYATGHQAERVAADYLHRQGYKIVEMNWRHVRAEIDIVAYRKQKLIFFEVKHRKNFNQGHGFDYITSNKLKQMAFAAELYVAMENYRGEYCLGAIELMGEDYQVTGCIDSL